jgi:methyl-accepting chemotaxis protein
MPESRRTRHLTVAHKVGALAALGVMVGVVLVGLADRSLGTVERRLNAQVTTSEALRNHLEGDMMHDALRADVLAALGARTADDKASVRADLADHAKTFRARLAANQKLPLAPEVRRSIASVTKPLAAYIESAQTTVAAALADPEAARAQLPEFMERFHAMEDAQEKVSDQVVAASRNAKLAASRSVKDARRVEVLGLIVALAALAVVATRLARALTRPLRASVSALQALAEKDLTTELTVDSHDETRDMADAFNTALGNLRSALASIRNDSETVAVASSQLAATSKSIRSDAAETSEQSRLVADAGQEIAASVASVSAAVEEMSSSVGEIAAGTSEATRVAMEAVELAGTTTESVTRLGEVSAEIGEVVGLIAGIAEQTNLLALNATIEAARAGESGKGFAVVANEVKELASETAKATNDIGRRVEAVQAQTASAVESIERITEIIHRISQHQATIAAAIEEQSATTVEIGRNVSEAAEGTNHIAQNIEAVAASAESTTNDVDTALAAAAELARVADNLRNLVDEFSYESSSAR